MIPFQENKSKISVVLYADLCGFSRSLSDTFSSFIKEIGGHFFHRLFGYFDGNLLTGCSKNILKLSILGQKSKQVFKDFCLQVFSKMQTLKNYQFFKTCQKIGRC
jgi:hypothetical protein